MTESSRPVAPGAVSPAGEPTEPRMPPTRPGEKAGPSRGVIIGSVTLLTVWAAVILTLFAINLRPLIAPILGSVATVALAAASVYSFWILGWRACRRFFPSVEEKAGALGASLIEFGLGIGGVIAMMFAWGVLGWIHPVTAWMTLGLPLVGPHRAFLACVWRRLSRLRDVRPSRFLIGMLLLTGIMTGLESLSPATSQDALVYHLAVPAQYIETGRIHYVPGNFFSAFPMNVEMLFTLGLLLRGAALAKWYHWLLGAAAAATVAALTGAVRSRGSETTSGPAVLLGAAIFATIPTAALISGWAYVDLGVVFFTSLSLLCALRFWRLQHRQSVTALRHPSTPFLVLAAIMAGLAAGCKYTAGFQAILLVALVGSLALQEKRSARTIVWQLAVVCGTVGLCVAPWFIKNFMTTGNPLFPFCYSIFGGEDWDAERARVLAISLSEWGGAQSAWSWLALPWKVSLSGQFFSQEHFDGVIGCAFLIGLPLLVLGVKASEEYRIALVFLILHGLFWILTTHQIRFLLPALAIAAALIAAGWDALRGGWIRRGVPGWILRSAVALNVLLIAVHFASHNPLPVVMGLESPHRYLQREVPGGDYAVFHHIETQLGDDARILFGSCGNPGFLCKRSYRSDALFENFTLVKILEASRDVHDLAGRLTDAGFTHLLFRFDCVFDYSGRKSEIPVEGQQRLAQLLNTYSRVAAQAGQTFLYELVPGGLPPGAQEGG